MILLLLLAVVVAVLAGVYVYSQHSSSSD